MSTYLDGFTGRFKVPVIDVRDPRLTPMQILDAHRVLAVQLGELGFDVGRHERNDRLGSLGRDEAVHKNTLSRSRTRSIDARSGSTWHRKTKRTEG